MGDSQIRGVTDEMRRVGLTHETFDVAATAADLAERFDMNESLDPLLEAHPGIDPTAFDPGWTP